MRYSWRISEIVTLDFEDLSILKITVHDFENRLGKPHTNQRERDFGVPMYLPKLEDASSNLSRELEQRCVKINFNFIVKEDVLTVISVYSAY